MSCQEDKTNFMKPLFIAVSLLLIANFSCKKSCPDRPENKICFSRTSTELKIENNINKEFYFAAFGQNILPLIDWAPLCDNNSISANRSVHKDLSTIPGYSDNDSLVVYWWECNENNPGQIQFVTLDPNQTVCK
jgi:hypothetical protein